VSVGRLRPADVLAGAAGVALVVALFLTWYTVPGELGASGPAPIGLSGWRALAVNDVLLAACGLLGIAVAITAATSRSPGLPIGLAIVAVLAGLLGVVLVLVRILDPATSSGPADRGAGPWLALAGALGVAAGAWWSIRDERSRGTPVMPPVETRPAPPAA
jgi:hypothetical protein